MSSNERKLPVTPGVFSRDSTQDSRRGCALVPITKALRRFVDEGLAIQFEDARSAGALGFLSRLSALTNLPYRQVPDSRFTRHNGPYVLHIQALPDIGWAAPAAAGVSLIGSSRQRGQADAELAAQPGGEKALGERLGRLRERWRFVLLDCPPHSEC